MYNWLCELKQFDFRRGAAEARGLKLRFALAQEGCSKECLDAEADVWHCQSAHSSLRSSLPSWTLHPKLWDLVWHVVLIESNFLSMPVRSRSISWKRPCCHHFVQICTGMFWHGFRWDVFGSLLNLLNYPLVSMYPLYKSPPLRWHIDHFVKTMFLANLTRLTGRKKHKKPPIPVLLLDSFH